MSGSARRRGLGSAGIVERFAPGADTLEDLVGGFEDGEFLRVQGRDDGVGGAFDLLDQVGVEEDRAVVQPCYRDQVEKWVDSGEFSWNLT